MMAGNGRKLSGVAGAFVLLLVSAIAAFGVLGDRPAGRSAVLTGNAAKELFRQCSRPAPEGVVGFWTPTTTDIGAIDAAWPTFLKTQKPPPAGGRKDLNAYYFQCAGFVRKGQKLIYINAFAPAIKQQFEQLAKDNRKPYDWKKQAEAVCDGGSSFFGVEYDPATRQFTHLIFNGR